MTHSSTATDAILDFAAAPHILPPVVRADALCLLADTLAVGAAGAASLEAKLVLNSVQGWDGAGHSRLLLHGQYSSAAHAAFFNGFSIHCLEWDAVHEPAVVHALSIVTASLLAASDRAGGRDADGFLTALAVGVDIASGLGLSATGPMRFFRPGTAGVIGAALAVARLEGYSRSEIADIIGLAYSFAGGTMQAHVEASIALPLQIAKAAQAAIQAVDMVGSGLTGPHDVLEGPFGYSALIEPLDLARYTAELGKVWRISEVSIKPFPSGRASHGALGAVSDLLTDKAFDPAQVVGATLHAPPLIHRLVGRPWKADMTPAYARLCLPFLLPMMLRDGQIDPGKFDAAGLADPEIAALAGKVDVVLDGNPDGNALAPQKLILHLAGGTSIERTIAANLGSPKAPMSAQQSAQKYDLCRRLAGSGCDLRIFDDPLTYASQPQ